MTQRVKRTKSISPYFREKRAKVQDKQQDFEGVPDILQHDLKVLFVGINPGLMSSTKGHHYAGPTNHFWPCLSESGLVDQKVTFEDDIDMPSQYRLGFTNLTARPSRKASDLSLAEQQEGIPILNEKISKYRPRVACFVGKGIYEIYSRQKRSTLGLQESTIAWSNGEGETHLFVMPSTSGLVTSYLKPAKLEFFKELCTIAEEKDKQYCVKTENEP